MEFQLLLAAGDTESPLGESHDCRFTAISLAPDEMLEIEQRRSSCSLMDQGLIGSFEIEVTPSSELVALVVEHLASGDWGAEIFEIEAPAGEAL